MTELATIQQENAELVPGQIGFNSVQRAMLTQLGLSDAPDGDLMLFSHVCQKSGLDPFRREIYMIGRNSQVTRYEKVDPNDPESNQRKVTRWETVYTIQTGIQGFRKRARELADAKGDRLGFEGPYWAGEDGVWKEIWPESTPPVAAKYVVFRNGEPIPAVTHYDEFVQTYNKDGKQVPNSMWSSMPRNQTAKCAEAMAIQRAYPDELSGLVLEDAAREPANRADPERAQEPAKRERRSGDSLRDRSRSAEVIDGEVESETEPGPAAAAETTAAPEGRQYHLTSAAKKKGSNRMFALFAEGGIKDNREHRLAITSELVGRPIGSSSDLTDTELVNLVNTLEKWKDAGTIAVDFAEMIDRPAEPATEPVQEELK